MARSLRASPFYHLLSVQRAFQLPVRFKMKKVEELVPLQMMVCYTYYYPPPRLPIIFRQYLLCLLQPPTSLASINNDGKRQVVQRQARLVGPPRQRTVFCSEQTIPSFDKKVREQAAYFSRSTNELHQPGLMIRFELITTDFEVSKCYCCYLPDCNAICTLYKRNILRGACLDLLARAVGSARLTCWTNESHR